jgi:hypothetical protein
MENCRSDAELSLAHHVDDNGRPHEESSFGTSVLMAILRQTLTSKRHIEEQTWLNAAVVRAQADQLRKAHGVCTFFVLARSGQVLEVYPTKSAALAAGLTRFTDHLFSVHEVTDAPRSVGGATHVC